ncbi:DYW_deaminase domain-containing protein [Psidium guajava]|nr:DYW_deaminase domain-containing protein [Psidium guajava]
MYNTLIRGFAESDTPHNSFSLFDEMRRKSVAPPDSFSFAFMLKAAANLRSLRAGIQLHCQALVHGLDTHVFVGTTMISMYGECGHADFALQVFDEMRDPNAVSWNAIISSSFQSGDLKLAKTMFDAMPFRNSTSYNVMLAGYTKAGQLDLAMEVFSAMPLKDDVSWSTMIVGFAHSGCFDEAFRFFRDLQRIGMRANEVSLTGVLSACADAGAFEFGKILHGLTEKSGFSNIISVANALLDTYSKCGNIRMARSVFEMMLHRRNIVSWTSMISGLAMQGYGEEAIELFHQMKGCGIVPDGITFISILYACSHSGLIEEGHKYFSMMKDVYGIEPAIEHYGCIVDLYGRAGQLQKAYDFVCQMPVAPTSIIWRTLLGACSIYNNVKIGEQVRERLSEIDPTNSGDHVLLSNIYAVAGKWRDVAAIRRSMKDKRMKKTPGWSMIEVDKAIYSFVAGQMQGEIAEEANEKLTEITLRLRVEGAYVPEVKMVLHDLEEEEKEDSVSRHSEKLAVAFGMSRSCKGSTIRIVKNLRVCRDCHVFMKLVSRLYKLEILMRDRSRFHFFRNGFCSCGEYW